MDDLLFELSEPIGLLIATVALVVWLAALVNAATTQSWLWFVLILITGFAALVYMLTSYQSPKKLREVERRRRKAADRRLEVRDKQLRALRSEVDELKAERPDSTAE